MSSIVPPDAAPGTSARTNSRASEALPSGKMINIGLVPFRMIVGGKLQTGVAGIAKTAQIERRNRVAAETEKAERAALKAVGNLIAATANLDEIIPVTRALENFDFFLR